MGRPILLDLTHGAAVVIDDDDLVLVADLTLYLGTNGYVYYSCWENGRSRPRTLHSLLIGVHRDRHVDHINGDKLDNRRSNLRVVSHQMNQVNRRRLNRNNRSGTRGVQFVPHVSTKHPWRAQITAGGKNYHLGMFACEADAVTARRAAEREHFGEECP